MSIYSFNNLSPITYKNIVKAPVIQPIIRLTMLYPNESFKEDITKYVQIDSGSLDINYQQGQRRSLNFTLDNSDGRFLPSVDKLWINSKFRLELGFKFGEDDYVYNSAGIFVISNPEAVRTNAERTISISCVDKFALLDGTLGGTLDGIYTIYSGSNVKNAIQQLLYQDNGNHMPIDVKPIIFDSLFANAEMQYDISKEAGGSIGDFILDMANMLGCDVWYGVEGNLIIRSGATDITKMSQPTLWEYNDGEMEYLNNTTTYSFDMVKNVIIVVGANINGDNVYKATSTNTNPQSPTRVSLIGTKLQYIEDANIYNDELARQRADYELVKQSILANTVTLNSTYMIHLDVNNCISLTDSYYGYYKNRFVIQSINIPLGTSSTISISCTNVNTLPFYPGSTSGGE